MVPLTLFFKSLEHPIIIYGLLADLVPFVIDNLILVARKSEVLEQILGPSWG